ncbi:hypothetical protein BC828DRAFT_385248 [Blastocladiella britannica]|nr:hypothetical protein BC828DRAFT_385248 [Blastocladiella britannica]
MAEFENGNWTLIESDPGVFTELIRSLGVTGLEVEEIYDLDSYQYSGEGAIHGLIFLFKHDAAMSDSRSALPWDAVPDVFFAQQVINNACATQAILSILMNAPGDVKLGTELEQFKQFTASFDPELKGLSITNSETMRTVHNSFARADPFVNEIKPTRDEDAEDNFHFLAYVPTGSGILELDGLKPGPIRIADVPIDETHMGRAWIGALVPEIQRRIAEFAGGEIRFNLMAIVQSKEDQLRAQMEDIKTRMEILDLSEAQRTQMQQTQLELQVQLEIEADKMERYKRENARRRHNFLPLVIELLKQMAEKGALDAATDKAKEAAKAKRAAAIKAKATAAAEQFGRK